MNKALKIIGGILLLVIIIYGIYIIGYLILNPYIVNGPVPAGKVAEESVEKDIDLCIKVNRQPYPFYKFNIDSDIKRSDMIALCYLELAELKGDKDICNLVMSYVRDSYNIQNCESRVDLAVKWIDAGCLKGKPC